MVDDKNKKTTRKRTSGAKPAKKKSSAKKAAAKKTSARAVTKKGATRKTSTTEAAAGKAAPRGRTGAAGEAKRRAPLAGRDLVGARRELLQRFGERLKAVHEGELTPDLADAERLRRLALLRADVERLEASREEILRRIDTDVERKRRLIAELESWAPEKLKQAVSDA